VERNYLWATSFPADRQVTRWARGICQVLGGGELNPSTFQSSRAPTVDLSGLKNETVANELILKSKQFVKKKKGYKNVWMDCNVSTFPFRKFPSYDKWKTPDPHFPSYALCVGDHFGPSAFNQLTKLIICYVINKCQQLRCQFSCLWYCVDWQAFVDECSLAITTSLYCFLSLYNNAGFVCHCKEFT